MLGRVHCSSRRKEGLDASLGTVSCSCCLAWPWLFNSRVGVWISSYGVPKVIWQGVSIDLKHQVESGTSWGGQGRVLELWWMAHVPIFLISHRLYERRQSQYTHRHGVYHSMCHAMNQLRQSLSTQSCPPHEVLVLSCLVY